MRRLLVITLVAAGTSVSIPTGAAATSISPTAIDFGSQAVGTSAAPRTATLTVTCPDGVCAIHGFFYTSVVASGDFTQTNDCPTAFNVSTMAGQSCTINVGFAPEVSGLRSGTLTTGVTGGPVPGSGTPGPTISLSGVGTVAPVAKRKCKRKKSRKAGSAAKKKCKKARKR